MLKAAQAHEPLLDTIDSSNRLVEAGHVNRRVGNVRVHSSTSGRQSVIDTAG
jgi:hypothetical protein